LYFLQKSHPESRPFFGHEITTMVMKFIAILHDSGHHFHDHPTSNHDRRHNFLYMVPILYSGHEFMTTVMIGTLRFRLNYFLKLFF